MLTIHGRATSSNVQAVMWGVAEMGIEHQRLDWGLEETLTRSALEINPEFKIGLIEYWKSCFFCSSYLDI